MRGVRQSTIAISDDEELSETAKVDFNSLPQFVKEELAESALNAFLRFMKRSDAREILDRTHARLIAEGSTLHDPKPAKQKGAKV